MSWPLQCILLTCTADHAKGIFESHCLQNLLVIIVESVSKKNYTHVVSKQGLLHSSYITKSFLKKMLYYNSQWAKTRKKVHFGRTVHCLSQRLTSMFFEKISECMVPLKGNRSEENFSKNVDFSLWGKQCIVLPNWTFSAF